MPAILQHVENRLPSMSHGSPEKVRGWLNAHWREAGGDAQTQDDLIREGDTGAIRDYLDAAHDVGEAAGEAD
jgi:hypothetical protein